MQKNQDKKGFVRTIRTLVDSQPTGVAVHQIIGKVRQRLRDKNITPTQINRAVHWMALKGEIYRTEINGLRAIKRA